MEPDIRDIKGLVSTVGIDPVWLIAFAAGLLVAALGVFLYVKYRKKRGPEPTPRLPADREALEALERLRACPLEERAAVKRFHFELSEIYRRYLERRFEFPATDRTSEELSELLPKISELTDGKRQAALKVLRDTDLVKFTDFDPGPEKSLELWQATRNFVTEYGATPPPAETPQ